MRNNETQNEYKPVFSIITIHTAYYFFQILFFMLDHCIVSKKSFSELGNAHGMKN